MQLQPDELLAAGLVFDNPPVDAHPGTDLTPLLRGDLAIRDTPAGNAIAAGAAITFGIPWLPAETNAEWFGRRLFVWSHGLPTQRLVGITMSRIGRQPERHQPVFDAIRTAIVRMDVAREIVLISHQTAAARYAARAAILFGRPTLTINANHAKTPWSEYWTEQIDKLGNEDSVGHTVMASPLLSGTEPDDSPLGDRLLIALAHRAVCVHIRRRGHTHRLLSKRLKSTAWPAGSVFVRQGEMDETSRDLIENGGIGWLVVGNSESSDPVMDHYPAEQLSDVNEFNVNEYFTHCTRRCDGPWPGETELQFLDDLLLDRQGADHSAWATLCRIVSQQRLVASSDVIRGKTPVVCLSECSARELVQRRTFRSHRGKWDYEPFGICIRRDWLIDHGAKPVIYLAREDWSNVKPEQAWHYQTETTADKTVNWSHEREWRFGGDLDLSRIPADSAFVFVPDENAAGALASICRWPIVVLPDND